MDQLDEQITGVHDQIYKLNKSAFINPHISPKAEATPRGNDRFNQGRFTYEEDDTYRIMGTPKSNRNKEDLSTNNAPSFVKFYKFEELKERFGVQNRKDEMRSRLKNKLKLQDQKDPAKMDNAFKISSNVVQGLHKAEQQSLQVRN